MSKHIKSYEEVAMKLIQTHGRYLGETMSDPEYQYGVRFEGEFVFAPDTDTLKNKLISLMKKSNKSTFRLTNRV